MEAYVVHAQRKTIGPYSLYTVVLLTHAHAANADGLLLVSGGENDVVRGWHECLTVLLMG